MILHDLSKSVLYQDENRTFKKTLEKAAEEAINLSHGNFRGQKLYGAKLDGLTAAGASFWGVDCRESDLSGCDLRDADFRGANLQNACLAESNCEGVNFSGAYLSGAILRQCNMERVIFTCPSLFDSDFEEVGSFKDAIYSHKGEVDLVLDPRPVLIRGLSRRVVIFENCLLWGSDLIFTRDHEKSPQKELFALNATIRRFR